MYNKVRPFFCVFICSGDVPTSLSLSLFTKRSGQAFFLWNLCGIRRMKPQSQQESMERTGIEIFTSSTTVIVIEETALFSCILNTRKIIALIPSASTIEPTPSFSDWGAIANFPWYELYQRAQNYQEEAKGRNNYYDEASTIRIFQYYFSSPEKLLSGAQLLLCFTIISQAFAYMLDNNVDINGNSFNKHFLKLNIKHKTCKMVLLLPSSKYYAGVVKFLFCLGFGFYRIKYSISNPHMVAQWFTPHLILLDVRSSFNERLEGFIPL